MKTSRIAPEFIEVFPESPEPHKLYISIKYRSALHKCCCGCGRDVVTPISPTDWKLTYDGANISLHPSIGNWSFPCKSHYWIRDGGIQWAEQWNSKQIANNRNADQRRKDEFYHKQPDTPQAAPQVGYWSRLWNSLWS